MLHSSPMQVESALLFESPAEIFTRIYHSLQPGGRIPAVDLKFRPFTNANSRVRLRDNCLEVRITDLLAEAPNPILEALAWMLLTKLLRRRTPTTARQVYRRYMNQEEVRARIHAVRSVRGRKQQHPPAGQHFHLEAIYHRLNQSYFGGRLPLPTLGWSLRHSRTRLGHYDPSHHSITLSRLLDRPGVPVLVVEYVLFHEMLHIACPAEHEGARRCIHTAEFRRAERAYPHFREARKCLQKLLAGAD